MFVSSLPPVVCSELRSDIRYFCVFAYSGVQHILCYVFGRLVASFSGLLTFDCFFGIL
jgi:hypothetical protein